METVLFDRRRAALIVKLYRLHHAGQLALRELRHYRQSAFIDREVLVQDHYPPPVPALPHQAVRHQKEALRREAP